jgi:hypothetical protein
MGWIAPNFHALRLGRSARPLWGISGSADHVDGLPPTRPVYLNKRTRLGRPGGVSHGPNAEVRGRFEAFNETRRTSMNFSAISAP